jgi:hypothetical protein
MRFVIDAANVRIHSDNPPLIETPAEHLKRRLANPEVARYGVHLIFDVIDHLLLEGMMGGVEEIFRTLPPSSIQPSHSIAILSVTAAARDLLPGRAEYACKVRAHLTSLGDRFDVDREMMGLE